MSNVPRYGLRPDERYPKGHPLGGRFKPRGLGAVAEPAARVAVGFYRRNMALLSHPFARQLAAQAGVSPQRLEEANRQVMAHATRLLTVVAQSRPKVAEAMAGATITWGDFGDAPLAAWFDPNSKAIILNLKHHLGPRGSDAGLLRTLTHEMAHLLDEHVGQPGQSAFAGAFQDFHQWVDRRVRDRGLEAWLYHTRLAYPATGFYGMAGDLTASLSEEYVAVLSELWWHSPQDFARLERLLRQGGYQGPDLRALMLGIWGGGPPPVPAEEIPSEWLQPLDGRALGLKSKGRVVPWKKTYQGNWREHLLAPFAGRLAA